MNILYFIQYFPSEASYIAYLKEQRKQSDVFYKSCDCMANRWDANQLSFECKHYHNKQSLCSRIVIEHSKLSFRYWVVTILLLTYTKKSFPTEELRRQLGYKRYQPIREMAYKLRDVIGKCDEHCQLTAQVELDEGFFSAKLSKGEKDKQSENGTWQSKEIQSTDNEHVQSYQTIVRGRNSMRTFLSWLHVAISYTKKLLLGVHHKSKTEYSQYHLHEFYYKFDRLYFEEKLFNRLTPSLAITSILGQEFIIRHYADNHKKLKL